MDEEEGFQFKHVSKEDFDRNYKQVIRNRQEQKDAQNWNNYMESIKDDHVNSKNTYFVKNVTEAQQSERVLNKNTETQLRVNNPPPVYSLHDPYDLHNIHGLRNRLYKTFNEFAKILENALLPPVLKSRKKVQIKIKNCAQKANKDYIFDLNSLLSEIKKDSKNEKLHTKKNKFNVEIKKNFQMKLIQCYKLAIETTKICSQTLEADIYNPIQSKMKSLIQIISSLSLITRKYLYGELYKKKKEESSDLVKRCKDITSMLDESGYEDTENENPCNNHDHNTLSKLANKAKTKIHFHTTNANRLSMYEQVKPKLGSCYAQKWSKRSLELTTIIDNNKCSFNDKMIKNSLLSKIEKISNPRIIRSNYKMSDDIHTAVEEYPTIEFNIMHETDNQLFCNKETKKKIVRINEETNVQTLSKKLDSNKLETPNNVRLDIVKVNPWRNFPIKNLQLTDNGQMLLNISPDHVKNIISYKRLFQQFNQSDTIFKITETVMEDLVNEALSKFDEYSTIMINRLIRMELFE